MTAICRALPFLVKAQTVSVTMVDPPYDGETATDELCVMLSRYGI